ncbi:raffinose/stachyose/melibiose transport system substrate-binding protein [Actinoplanes lutulentus]|uniref:Carbohydrate ABC transporter substrate-binding protein (CUT1 family) n=1 Tax=Actinoplanes lutulentus TaxID=1287878 RepID=A0A327Z5A3_9ACTN|nr:ABC transporter substrate-binding protein [Actinoplanes lutulentus]MBB2948316.1 raffinose/stachyose/melibiose transport system substrate-binding protein [Actinoplanes lutulentus]RAK30348.1 carbohydrate ABC transporter substrate-binding protein (CUT1 family) [Actinoplanes lutulentus]
MKRWISAVSALLLTVGLTACTDPGAEESATDPGSITWPDATAKLDGVKLTIWAAQNSNTVPTAVIKGFQAATGASVEVVTIPDPYEQGIQTKVATGDKPDLAFWQPTASMLTALNAKTNLQSLDGAPWLSKVDPALVDITGILDKTRYAALVTSPAVEGVYYNKEVLAGAGISSLPTSFDELVETARSLKAKNITPFYEMGADRWATQWWVQIQLADAAKAGLWDRINTGQEKFTDATVLDTVKRYDALIKEGLFNSDIKTAKFEDQGTALLDGKAAMVVQVNSFFGQLQAKADTATLDKKIGFFPIAPSGNVGTFIPDQSNALVAFKTGDAKREAAARQLLSYWMGPGYQDFITVRNTVSLQTGVSNPPGVPQALLDVHAAVGASAGSMQALAVANPDLYLNLADMIAGTMTPEQVAEATQKQFEQLAKAAGYLK